MVEGNPNRSTAGLPRWSPAFRAFLVVASLALAVGAAFVSWHVSLREASPAGMLAAALGGALVIPYLCVYARLIWRATLANLADDATMLTWARRLRAWRLGIVAIWLLVALPTAVPFAASRLPLSRLATMTPAELTAASVNSALLAGEITLGIGLIVSIVLGAAGYGVSASALRHIHPLVPRTLPEGKRLKEGQADAYLPEKIARLRHRVGKHARLSFAFTWDEALDLEGETSKSKSAKRRRKRQGASTTGNPRADAIAEIAQSAAISHLRLFTFCFVAFVAWVVVYIALGVRYGFLS